ncbi:hypothetical protein EVJ58_g4439 [Rhodofomes roseus]|uniref:Uncharacterized protein n=1 Tax=Rhodofomes roseus TaxID=34475 RepID=A0A4Y9YJC7_9APHY|nr:hypothetical protein EVJ58_g4439 [Rhodofomes roseus]
MTQSTAALAPPGPAALHLAFWQGPEATHPVSIALEDAALVTIGVLLAAHLLSSFLSSCQELLEERCAAMKTPDIKNVRMNAMFLGPRRDACDAELRGRAGEPALE